MLAAGITSSISPCRSTASRRPPVPAACPPSTASSAARACAGRRRQDLLEGPLTWTAGVDYDTSSEARQGYINNLGVRGALKRDEDNDVENLGAYLQAEWQFLPRWSVSAGVRYTKVDFTATDRYVVTGNPNDSGSTSYGEWTPTVGLMFNVTPAFNVYASYGRAFETPTTIELAYRPDGGSGAELRAATVDQRPVRNRGQAAARPLDTAQRRGVRHPDLGRDRHRTQHRRALIVPERG